MKFLHSKAFHIGFIVFIVLSIAFIIIRFSNFGVFISQEEIFADGEGEYEDTLDCIYPLMGSDNIPVTDRKVDTILMFGNDPLANDRDSKDNLCKLIANATDCKVYNASIEGSYLANQDIKKSYPEGYDALTFYRLMLALVDDTARDYLKGQITSENNPVPQRTKEVYDLLSTINMDEVDVIGVMYDANDYLLGHAMYNNDVDTDIYTFAGNLQAGIELIKTCFPHIRIIVMSPTYAYAVDDKGEYQNSDIFYYANDLAKENYVLDDKDYILSTFSIKECDACINQVVSFVDNLYGTITADNCNDYLTDNIHLNAAGRKLLAERFRYALNYYNRED